MPAPSCASFRALFRCDGTVETGLGHVSRCIGLAEALDEREIEALFLGDFGDAACNLLSALPSRVLVRSLLSAADVAAVAEHHGVAVIIVDSYVATSEFIRHLSTVRPVIVIDDFARLPRYDCAAVLNFTVTSSEVRYPRTVRSWLGPGYFLPRRTLRRLRARERRQGEALERLLVAVGGFDRVGISSEIARVAVSASDTLTVAVVTASPSQDLLAAAESCRGRIRILPALRDISGPMAWADACVTGGGLTKYESLYLGLPTAVVAQTPEEASDTRILGTLGACLDLGLGCDCDWVKLGDFLRNSVLRRQLATHAAQMFPMDPAARVAAEIERLIGS